MSLKLRKYQITCAAHIRMALEQDGSAVLQMPTASGKTYVAAKLADEWARRGKRVWFIGHRVEIIAQAEKIFEKAGIPFGSVLQGHSLHSPDYIHLCMIGSLPRRAEDAPEPDVLIFDECHHVAAKSWVAIIEKYPNALRLGLTATPARLDGQPLAPYFKRLVTAPSVKELRAAGHLAGFRYFAPHMPDLGKIKIRKNEYDHAGAEAAMSDNVIVGDVVEHYRRHADGKTAIVFAISVKASLDIVARFNAAGIAAAHVDASTPSDERKAAIDALATGTIKVLSNVEIFTEGFDLPSVGAIILLRPTQSLTLFLQMVGRGMRPSPDGEDVVILDHAALCADHGLPDEEYVWSLGSDKPRRKSEVGGGPARRLRRCPQCHAVHEWALQCPECGEVYSENVRSIEEMSGELRELSKETPAGHERLFEFSKRIRCHPSVVLSFFKRGLPRHVSGAVPIEDGIAWVVKNCQPNIVCRITGGPESSFEKKSAFAKRIGVDVKNLARLVKRGLPTLSNNFIDIETGLTWVKGNLKPADKRRSFKKPYNSEGLLSRRAAAKALNTHTSKIALLIKNGMPVDSSGFIDLAVARRWLGDLPPRNYSPKERVGTSDARKIPYDTKRRSQVTKMSHSRAEVKAKIKAASKANHSRPDVKSRHSAAIKAAQNRPEYKAKRLASFRAAIACRMAAKLATPSSSEDTTS